MLNTVMSSSTNRHPSPLRVSVHFRKVLHHNATAGTSFTSIVFTENEIYFGSLGVVRNERGRYVTKRLDDAKLLTANRNSAPWHAHRLRLYQSGCVIGFEHFQSGFIPSPNTKSLINKLSEISALSGMSSAIHPLNRSGN